MTVECCDRWQVYFRLQELGIACQCRPHQPLWVDITSPNAALQLWSVVRHVSGSRQDLAQWLDHCWQLAV